jgi:hypothetical protein
MKYVDIKFVQTVPGFEKGQVLKAQAWAARDIIDRGWAEYVKEAKPKKK